MRGVRLVFTCMTLLGFGGKTSFDSCTWSRNGTGLDEQKGSSWSALLDRSGWPRYRTSHALFLQWHERAGLNQSYCTFQRLHYKMSVKQLQHQMHPIFFLGVVRTHIVWSMSLYVVWHACDSVRQHDNQPHLIHTTSCVEQKKNLNRACHRQQLIINLGVWR
jgi:hypothetical protein